MFLGEKNIKFSPPLPACHSYDRHSQKGTCSLMGFVDWNQ